MPKLNKNLDEEKSFPKVRLNWYPGHMAKTKRQIIEDLKLIDVVVEMLDSRIPVSSQNPDIAKITQNKLKVIILNKSDLSDSTQNKLWVQYFRMKKQQAILVDSNKGLGIGEVLKTIESIMKEKSEEYAKKGRIRKKNKSDDSRNTKCW